MLALKQRLDDLPSAKAQLRKGAETLSAKLPSGFAGLDVEAELYVRKAGVSTSKLRSSITVNDRKIPIKAFRDGRQV